MSGWAGRIPAVGPAAGKSVLSEIMPLKGVILSFAEYLEALKASLSATGDLPLGSGTKLIRERVHAAASPDMSERGKPP